MYLFGGYNGSTWLNDLWMFDIDTRQWTCIQESTTSSTTGSAATISGVRGGGENGGEEHADGDTVVLVAPSAGGGGGGHRREGSLAGGIGIGVGGASLSSITSSNEGPSRRFGYVSVVHNNKFVLFGGFDGARWLNDMFEFDLCTKTWKRIDARGSLPSMRSCPAWAKDDRYVYIHGVSSVLFVCLFSSFVCLLAGSNVFLSNSTIFPNIVHIPINLSYCQGYDGVERKADFFACDLSTYTWTELPCKGTAPSPRYFHSCCIHGSKLYAYGGYNGSDRLADMLAFDFETNHWSTVDCTSGERPSGRSSLVAQVHENNLYIFGGYNGSTVLNDFYRFRLRPVNVPPSALVSDMRRLMHREELSDVTFLIEGREVYANRALLAIRSEYFEAMLFGGMSESVTAMTNTTGGEEGNEMTQRRRTPIELRDISYKGFTKVLEYLYTDTVSELTWEMGMSLLISSEQFMLDRLKALCEDRLRKEICVENVIGVFIASHRHNARGLKEISLEYILRNLHDPIVIEGLNVSLPVRMFCKLYCYIEVANVVQYFSLHASGPQI